MRFRLSLALAALLLSACLEAQTFTGTVSGVVTDPNGAVIPNATVRIRNEATNDLRTAVSGGDGHYIFSQLVPGTYELTAELQGFRKVVLTGNVLRVNQTLEANIPLQIGEVTQVVEVTGRVTLLDTQSANRSVTLDQQTVLDLPTNARNLFSSCT